MRIRVETRSGQAGAEMPYRLCFDGRDVEIAEVLDEWPGTDYRYFKVRGEDDNLYILRLDEPRAEWELTMFQVPMAGALAATDSH